MWRERTARTLEVTSTSPRDGRDRREGTVGGHGPPTAKPRLCARHRVTLSSSRRRAAVLHSLHPARCAVAPTGGSGGVVLRGELLALPVGALSAAGHALGAAGREADHGEHHADGD